MYEVICVRCYYNDCVNSLGYSSIMRGHRGKAGRIFSVYLQSTFVSLSRGVTWSNVIFRQKWQAEITALASNFIISISSGMDHPSLLNLSAMEHQHKYSAQYPKSRIIFLIHYKRALALQSGRRRSLGG